jgi:hypothetical protein
VDSKNNGHRSWINPLLTQLNLVQEEQSLADFRAYWTQMEECQLLERIRRIVADVNGAAGHHVLELLDFLPPQRTVLRISYFKQHTKHSMEIVVRGNGAAAVFSKRRSSTWERYFPNHSRKGARLTVFDQDFRPAEILEEDIQSWISYLLSGFEKKFKPSERPQLSEESDLHMSAAVGKASA